MVDVILHVHAVPGAKKNEVVSTEPGQAVRIKISAPPVEGKANLELVDFLHEILHVRKTQLELVGGQNSREKRIRVSGLTLDEIYRLLAEQIKDK